MLSTAKLILTLVMLASAIGTAQATHPMTDLTIRWMSPEGEVLQETVLHAEDIARLEQREFSTGTPWFDNDQTFSGPPVGALAALGPGPVRKGTFIAFNAYLETLPAEDWTEHGAILATKRNGHLMDIREYGPYWVMFPIDSSPQILDTQRYHGRMVWQVTEVVFVVQ